MAGAEFGRKPANPRIEQQYIEARASNEVRRIARFRAPNEPTVINSISSRPGFFDEQADDDGVRDMFGHALITEIVQMEIVA
jgi:hypothetical protein